MMRRMSAACIMQHPQNKSGKDEQNAEYVFKKIGDARAGTGNS